MPRIGDIVTIMSTNYHRSALEIEGVAEVIGATDIPHRFLVRFLDTDEVHERHVDPVAQLIGVEAYVAKLNLELRGLAHVATSGRPTEPKGGGH